METIGTVAGNTHLGGTPGGGRLIAKIGSARILRGHDGYLDVAGETPGERNAALAWMFTVNPAMFARVRRCAK